jgi:hypothetical protein
MPSSSASIPMFGLLKIQEIKSVKLLLDCEQSLSRKWLEWISSVNPFVSFFRVQEKKQALPPIIHQLYERFVV